MRGWRRRPTFDRSARAQPADVYAAPLRAALRAGGIGFVQATANSCPPFPDLVAQGKDCRPYFAALVPALKAHHVDTVIIAARWTAYAVNSRFEGEGGVATGPMHPFHIDVLPSSGAYPSHMLQVFRDGLRGYLDAGFKVVLVYPSPEAGWNVPVRLAKLAFYDGEYGESVSTDARAYAARNHSVIEGLDSLVADNLYRVRPDEALCGRMSRALMNPWRCLYHDDDPCRTRGGAGRTLDHRPGDGDPAAALRFRRPPAESERLSCVAPALAGTRRRASRQVGMNAPTSERRPYRTARRGCAAVALALALAAPAVGLEPTLVSIGTGGKTGVYYIAGGTICDLVNAERWEHGVRCLAESSDGSIENLRDVRSGARTFGIVQSDWQYNAVEGTSVFREVGPDRELRSVFALFPEPFTVVARPDAGIAVFADLKGKRVSLGPAGSGGRATMAVVMEEMGWSEADFAYVADLGMTALSQALCNGEIDAAVFIVAHPNLTVEDMMSSCHAHLVPVGGAEIDKLVAAHGYYAASEIAAGTYPGQAAAVPTFSPTATMVTSSRTSPAVVYEVTRAVFANLDAFRSSHPAFEALEARRMVSAGLTAPLHEGALRYYEEIGLR